jgi:hypothetical protein
MSTISNLILDAIAAIKLAELGEQLLYYAAAKKFSVN